MIYIFILISSIASMNLCQFQSRHRHFSRPHPTLHWNLPLSSLRTLVPIFFSIFHCYTLDEELAKSERGKA